MAAKFFDGKPPGKLAMEDEQTVTRFAQGTPCAADGQTRRGAAGAGRSMASGGHRLSLCEPLHRWLDRPLRDRRLSRSLPTGISPGLPVRSAVTTWRPKSAVHNPKRKLDCHVPRLTLGFLRTFFGLRGESACGFATWGLACRHRDRGAGMPTQWIGFVPVNSVIQRVPFDRITARFDDQSPNVIDG